MPLPHRKTLLLSLLALAAGVALWSLNQWYQDRYIRPFSETTVLFDAGTLRLPAELAGAGTVRVVHRGTRRARATSATSSTWPNCSNASPASR